MLVDPLGKNLQNRLRRGFYFSDYHLHQELCKEDGIPSSPVAKILLFHQVAGSGAEEDLHHQDMDILPSPTKLHLMSINIIVE